MSKVQYLTNSDDILTELRCIYRACRRGELPSQDMTRLTYVLKTMSEVMTLKRLEARLDSLELRAKSGQSFGRRSAIEYQNTREAH